MRRQYSILPVRCVIVAPSLRSPVEGYSRVRIPVAGYSATTPIRAVPVFGRGYKKSCPPITP